MLHKPIFFLLLLISLSTGSQGQDTLRLTLQQAQEMAVRQSNAVQQHTIDQKIEEAQLAWTKARLYPQLEVSLDLRYFIERPVTLLPGAAVGQTDDVVPVQLGADGGYSPQLDINQVLFDKTLRSEIRIREKRTEIGSLQKEIAAGNIRKQVTHHYIQYLIYQNRIDQLAATEKRLVNLLLETRTLVQSGFTDPIEIDRIQLAIDHNRSEINKAASALQLSAKWLNACLNRPLTLPVKPLDSLEDLGDMDNLVQPQPESTPDLSQLPVYRMGLLENELASMRIEQQRKSTLPTVSFYGRLGVAAINKQFDESKNTELSWFFNSYVGIRTQWLLNSYIDNQQKIPELEWKKDRSELNLQMQQHDLLVKLAEAENQLAHAAEDFQLEKRQLAFAEKELSHVRVLFQAGKNGSRDVVQAEVRLSEAQKALHTKAFIFLSARFELQQIKGVL